MTLIWRERIKMSEKPDRVKTMKLCKLRSGFGSKFINSENPPEGEGDKRNLDKNNLG